MYESLHVVRIFFRNSTEEEFTLSFHAFSGVSEKPPFLFFFFFSVFAASVIFRF